MPRILLAEDDDSLRGFLARALERAGYEVTSCADGEEAVAVGAMQALTIDDEIVSTYREHGHALARGVSPDAVMAEMFGTALLWRWNGTDVTKVPAPTRDVTNPSPASRS